MVETRTAEELIPLHGDADVVFVDVRERFERDAGTIPGSIHVPRGFLEFIVDPDGPLHQPALVSGKRLILFCATGGRSMLAAKTLQDMGLERLSTIWGGFTAWRQHGGPVT